MFKLIVLAALMAVVAASPKPGYLAAPLAYSAPIIKPSAYAYSAYSSPLSYSAHSSGYSQYAYSGYAYPYGYSAYAASPYAYHY